MALTSDQIESIVVDRLITRWTPYLINKGAAPYAVVGVVQRNGADFGTPVLCMPEDLDERMLAELLIGVAMTLLESLKENRHAR